MPANKGWVKKFMSWFRGDDLDDVLRQEHAAMLTAEFGDASGGTLAAAGAVTTAEADALTGVATAVIDEPTVGSFRRHFVDATGIGTEAEVPTTVDEQYILAHEPEMPTTRVAATATTDGVTVARVPSTPKSALAVRVETGVTEITRVLGNVSAAVVQQTEVVERLSKNLGDLPAAVRTPSVYLETVTRQLEAQNARSVELVGRLRDVPTALAGIADLGRAQVQYLQQIAGTLDAEAERRAILGQRVAEVGETLESIRDAARAQVEVLTDLSREQRTALDGLKSAAELNTKRYGWLMFLMWTVTAVTVGGVAFVAYLIARTVPM